jgi:aminoglycoside phosphotransferase (APT) family kinase protein
MRIVSSEAVSLPGPNGSNHDGGTHRVGKVRVEELTELVRRHIGAEATVLDLRRLSGGANQETWSFDAEIAGTSHPLILRRTPGGAPNLAANATGLSLEAEAKLISLAAQAGVPVPGIRFVLPTGENLGSGFVMDRIPGETIARKILRDEEFASVRPRLARQCGSILAAIHRVDTGILKLAVSPAAAQLEQYRALYDAYDHPHPVFEMAFRWLADRIPSEVPATLVHGDFRNGNLIIGTDGVRAVLDWELAHLGDPAEDLGWICVNSWRFGEIDQPVGGFGSREEMFAGYESAGGDAVDPERVKWWETFGSLKWGIMCMTMVQIFRGGLDRSVERAAIGRRASEAELDLLNLIAPAP